MAIIRVKRGTAKPTTAQLNYLGELALIITRMLIR